MASGNLLAVIQEKRRILAAYEKRINGIKVIIADMNSEFDDDIKSVNKKITKCINELENGLKGCSITESVNLNMETCKLQYSGNDFELSSARENLSQELQRCQTKIATLECEIKSLESQLKSQENNV